MRHCLLVVVYVYVYLLYWQRKIPLRYLPTDQVKKIKRKLKNRTVPPKH